MIDVFKRLVPVGIKRAIKGMLTREDIRLPSGRRVFMFLAADYGNVGDLAIAAAQSNFLANHVRSHHLVRVPISRTGAVIHSIRRQATPSDLVTIVGGGNMGSLYADIEELRQLVIRSFPDNRIVCFPQTLDWDASVSSIGALRQIVRTYSRHPDIHVFARESVTRDKLAELFREHRNVKIGHAPDIVLSATAGSLGSVQDREPKGILKCLRDDRERALDASRYAVLDETLAQTGEVVESTDTHTGGARLDEARCARLLSEKIDQFRTARLVVTDRLHGMILSMLAGTPCLVFPNSNHKIRQTWEDWLTDVPQVRFMSLSDLPALGVAVKQLLVAPRRDPASPVVDPSHYAALSEALRCR